MARKYNYIYKSIVQSDTDVIGCIAYSLYKSEKVRYIEDFKEKNNTEPSEDELDVFHRIMASEESIARFRMQASGILAQFSDETLDSSIEQFEKDLKKNQMDALKEVVSNMRPKWWQNILWSVIASIIIIALTILFVNYNKISPSSFIQDEHADTSMAYYITPIKK